MKNKLTKIYVATLLLSTLQIYDVGASSGTVITRPIFQDDKNIDRYKLKLGDLYLASAYHAKFGFDDNPTSSSQSNTDSFFIENGLTIELYTPVYKDIEFESNLYFGYRYWLSGRDVNNDGLVIDSDNGLDSLALHIHLDDRTTLSLIDNIIVTTTDSDPPQINQDNEPLYFLDNDLAIQIYRETDPEVGSGVRVGQRDSISLNNEYEEREYTEQYIGLLYEWELTRTIYYGVFYNYSERNWKIDENSDGDINDFGLNYQYIINERWHSMGFIGYQVINTDKNKYVTNAESDHDGWIGEVKFSHLLSEKIEHNMSIRHENRLSKAVTVNISEDTTFDYAINYWSNSEQKYTLGFNWLHSQDKSTIGEDYDVYTVSLDWQYKYSKEEEVRLNYSHIEKTSDSPLEYSRNQFTIEYIYNF